MSGLSAWNDTGTTQAIVEFVETAARDLAPEERVAVFDNDGTLWSEKPMPIELGFILERWAAMAEKDASLREKQPWMAAYDKDYAFLAVRSTSTMPATTATSRWCCSEESCRRSRDRRWRSTRPPPRRSSRMHRTPRSAGCCATAGTCRWSSYSATSRATASRASSRRGAAATSCGRSRARSTRSRPSASSGAPTA